MRRILHLAVFLTACGEQSASVPKSEQPARTQAVDTLDECVAQALNGLSSCMVAAKTPKASFVCGSAVAAKKHVCERVYLGKDPTNIAWAPMSDYEWIDDPKVPTTDIPCPNEFFGDGWRKLQEEQSLGTICLRNDLTGEVY